MREGQVHWHLARMYMTGELVGKPKEEDKTTDPSSFYNAGALNVLWFFHVSQTIVLVLHVLTLTIVVLSGPTLTEEQRESVR